MILAIVLVSTNLAQVEAKKEPQLTDEFGGIPVEDLLARLDRFANEIRQDESTNGLIITHGPEGDGRGSGRGLNTEFVHYLVKDLGLPESRIKTIYAGRYSSPTRSLTRLWILPQGSELPEPFSCSPDMERKGLLFETERLEIGPPEDCSRLWVGSTSCPYFESLTKFAGFADIVRQQPESRVYVIGRHFAESAPGTWRRLADDYIQELKAHGISENRISRMFGGYLQSSEERGPEEAQMQLWVLPPDSPPPVTANLEEKRPEKPRLIGQAPFWLDDEVTIPKLFDILGGFPNYRLAIVFEHDMRETEFVTENNRRIFKYVQAVRSDLLKRGIGKDRIELTKDRLPPLSEGDVRTSLGDVRFWLLPPGTRLPKEALSSP
ncbi:MAG: hypothetical protein J5I65_11335 [Aridibacter famidurans]|nr:hypothetical protein [Aridibacter famidurans]